MTYPCGDQRRLLAVQQAGVRNGVSAVEVRDTDETVPALRQRTLYVRLLLAVPATMDAGNVVIDGGERIGTVEVAWAAPAGDLPPTLSRAEKNALLAGLAEPDRVLVVRTAARGDHSRYTLRLVAGRGAAAPPAGFDPLLAAAEFSFKVECPGDFDCAARVPRPPVPPGAPPINYLAKDYASFRRTMLERMSLLAPDWTERNPADIGTALVELLAYAADELSYRQDAIATEAYLHTARSRISLRRHARLVDYRVHEGCNARAWVKVDVDSPTVTLPAGTTLLTRVPRLGPWLEPDSRDHRAALAADPVVFETVDTAVLHNDLATLSFYTWGALTCCLPAGATTATLRGAHPLLRAGDVIVLAETATGTDPAGGADPARRWAVRLVDVRTSADPSGGLFDTPPSPDQVEVTEIAWHERDALPFPLRVAGQGSVRTAVAWGNIVLADHGATVRGEYLGTVPPPHLTRTCTGDGGTRAEPVPIRFRPALAQAPLTHVTTLPGVAFDVPLTPALRAELDALAYGPSLAALMAAHDITIPPATGALRGTDPLWSLGDGATVVRLRHEADRLRASLVTTAATADTLPSPRSARPAVTLDGTLHGVTGSWVPVPDLLASAAGTREFTVETEHDGTALLRFGDGVHGLPPAQTTSFHATYRVGNGMAGNVGAAAIAHAVTPVTGITSVGNPLPATGGVDPESAGQIRRDAPQAFTVQERAVTETDYTEMAQRFGGVQKAAATMRWTGSWHTVFVTADRRNGAEVDPAFAGRLRAHLDHYRMAGYDVRVDGPRFVPLEIGIRVCAGGDHSRSDVERAVRDALSDRVLPDGRRGLFHPDNLTFGQAVNLSDIYAVLHAVPGVRSATVHTFQRQRQPASSGIADGTLPMGRLEIPRLDDDPNFPERGVLDVSVGGGR